MTKVPLTSFTLALFCCLGLTGGNFIYQIFAAHNWMEAAKLSFFQFWAIMFYYWLVVRNIKN